MMAAQEPGGSHVWPVGAESNGKLHMNSAANYAEISKEAALEYLIVHDQSRDDRLVMALQQSTSLRLFQIPTAGEFLRLIWQESDPTRFLTPPARPRTLGDIARRLKLDGRTFHQLANSSHQPGLDPAWFQPCIEIDESFKAEAFGRLMLVEPLASERRQSPRGTFYAWDGVHRTIVLAKKLFASEVDYFPVEAVLIRPRPT